MSIASLIKERELGRDAGLISLQDREENRLVCAHMLSQVRRELCLFTHDLDKPVYDQAPFLAGVREMALRNRLSRIRILLQDHERVVKQGHRLIELVRHLSSGAEIRVPHADWLAHPENFLLADQYGYVHRALSTRYEATADYFAPLKVRQLYKRFNEIWENSEVDSELRRLYL